MAHAKIVRPTLLHLGLPEDIRAKLDLYLYSEVEKRVPRGAYMAFFCKLLNDFFEGQSRRERLKLLLNSVLMDQELAESFREEARSHLEYLS